MALASTWKCGRAGRGAPQGDPAFGRCPLPRAPPEGPGPLSFKLPLTATSEHRDTHEEIAFFYLVGLLFKQADNSPRG